MGRSANGSFRKGFAVQDLAVLLCCLVVAGAAMVCISGANRDLSKAQVCSNNLRMLFTGLTAYVNQYNSYPPHAPYPVYAYPGTMIKDGWAFNTAGWDPNIGWILTHGLGIEPPAKVTMGGGIGHFIWYLANFDDLPDMCKCPSLPAWTMEWGPEIADSAHDSGLGPLENFLFQYALSYQNVGDVPGGDAASGGAPTDAEPVRVGRAEPADPGPDGRFQSDDGPAA